MLNITTDETTKSFKSSPFFQESEDLNWCGHAPIIGVELQNKISDHCDIRIEKIYNNKFRLYSEIEYNFDTILYMSRDNVKESDNYGEFRLQPANVIRNTNAYRNIDENILKLQSFENELISSTKKADDIMFIEFTLKNIDNDTITLFGSSDQDSNFFQFGKSNGQFGIGYGNSPLTENLVDFTMVEDTEYTIKAIHKNNTLSVYIDDVLLISKTKEEEDMLSENIVYIFGNHNGIIEEKDILNATATGSDLKVSGSDEFKYVYELEQDFENYPLLANKLYYPIDFTIKTMISDELDDINTLNSVYNKIDHISYFSMDTDDFKVYYEMVPSNGRKLEFILTIAKGIEYNGIFGTNIINSIDYSLRKLDESDKGIEACVEDDSIIVNL